MHKLKTTHLFLLGFFALILSACQQASKSTTASEISEIKAALVELNDCKKTLSEERERNIRKIIRTEIMPEVREIQLYSKKEIKKQRTTKGEALQRTLIGRVEWIETEDGRARFKARVDTGAQTNSLHAFNIKEKTVDGEAYIEFETIDSEDKTITFVEKVIKKSIVKSTSGDTDTRYVVEMKMRLGDRVIKTKINLNDRTDLKHKFLIGRNLLIGDYIVDVSQSRLLGGKK